MILKTQLEVVGKYKGASKFEFFKSIEVKDILEVQLELNQTGGGCNGYAAEVSLLNHRTAEKFDTSLKILRNYLDKIETREL